MDWFDPNNWTHWAVIVIAFLLAADVVIGGNKDWDQDDAIKKTNRDTTPAYETSYPSYTDLSNQPVKRYTFDAVTDGISKRVGVLESLPTNKSEGLVAWAERYVEEKTNPTVSYHKSAYGFTPDQVEALQTVLNRRGDPTPERPDDV